ncbi:MAG: HAD family hydrolase [Desulfovibrionaceae bacterium]|nr:HAD family hydrolase [Desulfovibrionaceae bacterium]
MTWKSKPLNGINIILDRDGTVIEEKHYLSDPAQVELLPGAAGALRMLAMAGARLFIVTNQSGIGRGYFDLAAYRRVEARVSELLQAEYVNIEATVFCPHAPDEHCACRKPAPGMWQELHRKFNLPPCSTLMIGDKMDDLNFGLNTGFAASILVLTGHGMETAAKYGFGVPCRQNKNNVCEVCNTDHLTKTMHAPRSRPAAPAPHAVAVNLAAAAAWIIQNFSEQCGGNAAGSSGNAPCSTPTTLSSRQEASCA